VGRTCHRAGHGPGIVPIALRELFTGQRNAGARERARTTLRLSLIVGGLLLVFGSLLRSADPIFASLVSLPELDVETIASHVILMGFCAWIAGGWAYGALAESPSLRRAPERFPVTLGALDLTTALGTLAVLFGAYVLTQLGWFFGGERFLRATTGLTAAQYARQGFFQMVWVVTLVVPLLLATRAVLAPDPALARRHTLMSLPIVALLGAISCPRRCACGCTSTITGSRRSVCTRSCSWDGSRSCWLCSPRPCCAAADEPSSAAA
jgi:hypothetical protein